MALLWPTSLLLLLSFLPPSLLIFSFPLLCGRLREAVCPGSVVPDLPALDGHACRSDQDPELGTCDVGHRIKCQLQNSPEDAISTCRGRSCFVSRLNGSLYSRGCTSLGYPFFADGLRICILPDCNADWDIAFSPPEASTEAGPVAETTATTAVTVEVETSEITEVTEVLGLLLAANGSLSEAGNGTRAANETVEMSMWHKHRTISGLVLFILICLCLFALAIVCKYIWSKVLKERCADGDWEVERCPDPRHFWKSLTRERGGGEAQRESAYYASDGAPSVRFSPDVP